MMYFILAVLAVASAENCNRLCHMNWEPVCGSDGVTYGNQCELTSTACVERKSVVVAHQGECVACNMICHPTWEPVCGSDGKTYGNQCELESLSCLAKKAVTIAHQGECVACNMICHPTWEPVCGSDGKTYGNQCELESLSCLAKKAVTIAHQGECVLPGVTHGCNMICHPTWEPVCGSDGKTYGNQCELESLSCVAKKAVAIAHQGECVLPGVTHGCNMICHPTWEPVCGSDGQTYGNTCELESLSCIAKKAVSVAYSGECQKCQNICTMQWDPVCGSDGVTYGNDCELTSTACMARKSINIAKRGEC